MKSFSVINGAACPAARPVEPLHPHQLGRTIMTHRTGLGPDWAATIPLTLEHQRVLLDYSHYLSVPTRNALLLRLAGRKRIFAPLFYELADRAGRQTGLKAMGLCRRAGNTAGLEILEGLMGFALPEGDGGFWRSLGRRLMGLAY